MFPEKCGNCGLETDELNHCKKDAFVSWYICNACYGKLIPHEFYPHRKWTDLCRICGKGLTHDIHT